MWTGFPVEDCFITSTHVQCHAYVIYKGFHNVFGMLAAGPANKPSTKLATAPSHVPLAHARRTASPIPGRFGLYPMKSKLTEQAAVV